MNKKINIRLIKLKIIHFDKKSDDLSLFMKYGTINAYTQK